MDSNCYVLEQTKLTKLSILKAVFSNSWQGVRAQTPSDVSDDSPRIYHSEKLFLADASCQNVKMSKCSVTIIYHVFNSNQYVVFKVSTCNYNYIAYVSSPQTSYFFSTPRILCCSSLCIEMLSVSSVQLLLRTFSIYTLNNGIAWHLKKTKVKA